MKWQEFIEKLAALKKESKTAGASVPCIATLIYSGAFDSMIEDTEDINTLCQKYNQMFLDVKKALKSTAKLPSKNKAQLIGIDDIDSYTKLGVWRQIVNPLSEFDFTSGVSFFLKSKGFLPQDHPVFPWKRLSCKNHPQPLYVCKSWDFLYTDQMQKGSFFSYLVKDKIRVGFVGVIQSASIRPYGSGKERLVVDLHNGKELMNGICKWPMKEGNLHPVDKTMKPGSLVFAVVKPGFFAGKPSGTITEWEELL